MHFNNKIVSWAPVFLLAHSDFCLMFFHFSFSCKTNFPILDNYVLHSLESINQRSYQIFPSPIEHYYVYLDTQAYIYQPPAPQQRFWSKNRYFIIFSRSSLWDRDSWKSFSQIWTFHIFLGWQYRYFNFSHFLTPQTKC